MSAIDTELLITTVAYHVGLGRAVRKYMGFENVVKFGHEFGRVIFSAFLHAAMQSKPQRTTIVDGIKG